MEKLTRAPIVTVLGHVDHGKTTLLDSLRKTSLTAREAGGITQSIGASQVVTKDGAKITFIDTPGHSAFSKMRARGANVADIALLVVDASSGIKPQTVESLNLIKEASIPFIVVATKSDLPGADSEAVQGQLEKEGVTFEGRGGDTPLVSVSAKKGEGLTDLLDVISLLSQVKGLKGSPEGELEAPVIETSKGKRGGEVTVVVRSGKIKVGDLLYSESEQIRVRGLFDHKGSPVEEIAAGEPGLVLGFSKLPLIGSVLRKERNSQVSEFEKQTQKPKIEKNKIPIFIKARNSGALEAVVAGSPSEIAVVDAKVGDVFESDVLEAKASGARIYTFESKAAPTVLKLAESEGVKIQSFNVIYELFESLNDLVKAGAEEVVGRAEILASFPYEKKKVAGSKVLEGVISKTARLKVIRGDKVIGEAKAVSMKKGKEVINEAKTSEEFGIIFDKELAFEVGDMILSIGK